MPWGRTDCDGVTDELGEGWGEVALALKWMPSR